MMLIGTGISITKQCGRKAQHHLIAVINVVIKQGLQMVNWECGWLAINSYLAPIAKHPQSQDHHLQPSLLASQESQWGGWQKRLQVTGKSVPHLCPLPHLLCVSIGYSLTLCTFNPHCIYLATLHTLPNPSSVCHASSCILVRPWPT